MSLKASVVACVRQTNLSSFHKFLVIVGFRFQFILPRTIMIFAVRRENFFATDITRHFNLESCFQGLDSLHFLITALAMIPALPTLLPALVQVLPTINLLIPAISLSSIQTLTRNWKASCKVEGSLISRSKRLFVLLRHCSVRS